MSEHLISEQTLKIIIKAAILEADLEKEQRTECKYLQKLEMTNKDHLISHAEWRAFKNDWDSLKNHAKKVAVGSLILFMIGIFGAGFKIIADKTPVKEIKHIKISSK